MGSNQLCESVEIIKLLTLNQVIPNMMHVEFVTKETVENTFNLQVIAV